jgi:hypothetical protein
MKKRIHFIYSSIYFTYNWPFEENTSACPKDTISISWDTTESTIFWNNINIENISIWWTFWFLIESHSAIIQFWFDFDSLWKIDFWFNSTYSMLVWNKLHFHVLVIYYLIWLWSLWSIYLFFKFPCHIYFIYFPWGLRVFKLHTVVEKSYMTLS